MTGEELTGESSRLRAAWMRHDSGLLDGYLVRDVEDPRINLQSILSRSFLIDAIWPDEFTTLIREEFRFGVARFLEYTGLDICDKNIANARRRFGSVDFRIEDFLAIRAENKSYDYLFVHDLFEHLSGAAIELALSHVSRVTRRQACLSFFNMADIPEHVIRPQGLYHWNRVSMQRVQESLMASARSIDVVPIGAFLRDNYGCTDYHNNGAYTLIVSFDAN